MYNQCLDGGRNPGLPAPKIACIVYSIHNLMIITTKYLIFALRKTGIGRAVGCAALKIYLSSV
jgi:hypothetical protein